tara:strand:- start:21 stop:179 length:159 start_codon:yes stop_codon:yes gene_type:complete
MDSREINIKYIKRESGLKKENRKKQVGYLKWLKKRKNRYKDIEGKYITDEIK